MKRPPNSRRSRRPQQQRQLHAQMRHRTLHKSTRRLQLRLQMLNSVQMSPHIVSNLKRATVRALQEPQKD